MMRAAAAARPSVPIDEVACSPRIVVRFSAVERDVDLGR
jgi:hypothetical protein